MLTTLCRLLMGSSQTRQNGIEPLRRDFWNDYPYHLLEEVREKSMYYYSRVRRKAWVLIGILAALVIMYLATVTVTFQRPCIIRDGHSCDHPVIRLAKNAQKSFNTTRDAQSQSLDEAVAEYRRRYQMPPPPYFDKWYEFVTERQTMMIDEFHNIYHAILPFWGLAPSTIRARAREDLGRPNVLMEVTIHHGLPICKNGGQGNFQEDGTIESLRKFAQWLPDMNLGFNVHDEPRVVVPHEELNRPVLEGRKAQARLNGKGVTLKPYFTQQKFEEPVPVHFNRFIDIEKQETWLYSRLLCPPSP